MSQAMTFKAFDRSFFHNLLAFDIGVFLILFLFLSSVRILIRPPMLFSLSRVRLQSPVLQLPEKINMPSTKINNKRCMYNQVGGCVWFPVRFLAQNRRLHHLFIMRVGSSLSYLAGIMLTFYRPWSSNDRPANHKTSNTLIQQPINQPDKQIHNQITRQHFVNTVTPPFCFVPHTHTTPTP